MSFTTTPYWNDKGVSGLALKIECEVNFNNVNRYFEIKWFQLISVNVIMLGIFKIFS